MSNLIQWNGAKYWKKTFNPVIGCRKRSEGCENCWACDFAQRFRGLYGSACNWHGTLYYAKSRPPKSGVIFCGNMSDWFQGEIPDEKILYWMEQLSAQAINLILTKQHKRLNQAFKHWEDVGFDWGDEHLWFGVTAENQKRLEERLPVLCNAGQSWLSLEPLLEKVDLSQYFASDRYYAVGCRHCGWTGMSTFCPGSDDWYTCPRCYRGEPDELGNRFIDWVVVGAESIGNRPGRECRIEWVESIVEQCRTTEVPVFVKQLHINGKLVKDINQFPEHLRIRQVPWHNLVIMK